MQLWKPSFFAPGHPAATSPAPAWPSPTMLLRRKEGEGMPPIKNRGLKFLYRLLPIQLQDQRLQP